MSVALFIEDGRCISDIAGENISRLLVKKPDEDFHFSDALRTIKSRLIWEGGKNQITGM